MHHAYPPRKVSKPPAWTRTSSRDTHFIRDRLPRLLLVLAACILGVYLLFGSDQDDPYHEATPRGGPSVVIVTLMDDKIHDAEYLNLIRENRENYAALFGYETFMANATDYDIGSAPRSWAKLMALRHTITKHPNCGHIWFLDQTSLILNPKLSLHAHILDEGKLVKVMLPDKAVVPGSIIKTSSHLQVDDAALLISQDKSGLVIDSMIIKNGEWAKFLLEQWMSPLYRSYNFEKAERHALDHAVQWHPTVLSKLALVPQDLLAPYSSSQEGEEVRDGGIVVLFEGCQKQEGLSCAQQLEKFWPKWSKALDVARTEH